MPDNSLRGRTALVTGAAKRIGKAIAVALAREGANVVIHYRHSSAEASELRSELAGLGVKTWLVRADFEKESEYGTLIRRANRLAGGLDILVNSASIFPPGPLERVSFDDLVQAVRVNAWVPFVLSRDFSRIAQRGRPAKIVNLLDSRITAMDFDHLAYLLSKQMLATLTRMTALRFAPHVTVNSVAPGAILPPPGKPRRYLAKRAQAVPLKRPGGPEDIAQAVLFLLKSDYISGNVLFVDGGMNLTEAHAWIGS